MRQPSRSSAQLLLTSEAAAAQLPPLRHIRRGIRRVKKDAGNPIPVLQTMEIPEEYTVTHRDEPFFLYDSGIDSPARILIFSTETNLRALTTSISNTMTKQKIITTTPNHGVSEYNTNKKLIT